MANLGDFLVFALVIIVDALHSQLNVAEVGEVNLYLFIILYNFFLKFNYFN